MTEITSGEFIKKDKTKKLESGIPFFISRAFKAGLSMEAVALVFNVPIYTVEKIIREELP